MNRRERRKQRIARPSCAETGGHSEIAMPAVEPPPLPESAAAAHEPAVAESNSTGPATEAGKGRLFP